jgi:hypothetical protein
MEIISKINFAIELYPSYPRVDISKVKPIVLLLLVFSNLYGIYFNVTYKIHPPTSLTSDNRPLDTDYKAIIYLLNITTPEDIILNDPNRIGFFITSFEIRNIVFTRFFLRQEHKSVQPYIDRAEECHLIFKHPKDYNYSKEVFQKYDIDYVFLSSSRQYSKELSAKIMTHKPGRNVIQFNRWFSRNPCLELIFHEGDSQVYKVID